MKHEIIKPGMQCLVINSKEIEPTYNHLKAIEMVFTGYMLQWSGSKLTMLSRNCKADDKNHVRFMLDFNVVVLNSGNDLINFC